MPVFIRTTVLTTLPNGDEHEIYFYRLADGRGWVHDFHTDHPKIRHITVIRDLRLFAAIDVAKEAGIVAEGADEGEAEAAKLLQEALAMLSSMSKEDLQAAIESSKEKKNLAILQSAIAKAEQEQLISEDDAAVIAEAKALMSNMLCYRMTIAMVAKKGRWLFLQDGA